MVPMHEKKRKGALHELTHDRPLPVGEQVFVRVLSVPFLGGVRGGFMVPMHARSEWRLSMNRPGHRVAARLGKAALKSHALQTLRDSPAFPNRAKRLECGSVRLAEPVRFIGAFRPAQNVPRVMVPMHAKSYSSFVIRHSTLSRSPTQAFGFAWGCSLPIAGDSCGFTTATTRASGLKYFCAAALVCSRVTASNLASSASTLA